MHPQRLPIPPGQVLSSRAAAVRPGVPPGGGKLRFRKRTVSTGDGAPVVSRIPGGHPQPPNVPIWGHGAAWNAATSTRETPPRRSFSSHGRSRRRPEAAVWRAREAAPLRGGAAWPGSRPALVNEKAGANMSGPDRLARLAARGWSGHGATPQHTTARQRIREEPACR